MKYKDDFLSGILLILTATGTWLALSMGMIYFGGFL